MITDDYVNIICYNEAGNPHSLVPKGSESQAEGLPDEPGSPYSLVPKSAGSMFMLDPLMTDVVWLRGVGLVTLILRFRIVRRIWLKSPISRVGEVAPRTLFRKVR